MIKCGHQFIFSLQLVLIQFKGLIHLLITSIHLFPQEVLCFVFKYRNYMNNYMSISHDETMLYKKTYMFKLRDYFCDRKEI